MRIALISLLFFLLGCQKELSCVDCMPGGQEKIAIVDYSGDPALDGCDWSLIVGNATFHPDNLDDAYKVDQLEVVVSFASTGGNFICGFGANIPVVHINSIREK